MDYMHLASQIVIVSVTPVLVLLHFIALTRGVGWTPILVLNLGLGAMTAVDQNPWATLIFVSLFLWDLFEAVKDWDRRTYYPRWLRDAPNREDTLRSLGRTRVQTERPGAHRPESVASTGEQPIYASKYKG